MEGLFGWEIIWVREIFGANGIEEWGDGTWWTVVGKRLSILSAKCRMEQQVY